jgi:hypothetical protein
VWQGRSGLVFDLWLSGCVHGEEGAVRIPKIGSPGWGGAGTGNRSVSSGCFSAWGIAGEGLVGLVFCV